MTSKEMETIGKIISSIEFLLEFDFWSDQTKNELEYVKEIFEEVLEKGGENNEV